MPRKRVSDAEKARRGTLQPCRVRDVPRSAGGDDLETWWSGLSKEAQLEGIWRLSDRAALLAAGRHAVRHFLRAYAVRERTRARHIAEKRCVESWLWQLSQRIPWKSSEPR